LLLLLLLALVWSVPSVLQVLRYRPLTLEPLPTDGWHEIRLGLHAHSNLSDGVAAPEEVARAAGRAGLDALFLTDHDAPGLRLAERGWVDGVLLLVGIEVSTDSGHLLALGMEDADYRVAPEAAEAVDDIHQRGGLAIVAHPVSSRFPWLAPELMTLDGMELLNGDSAWRRALHQGRLWRAAYYPLARQAAMLGVLSWPEQALEMWDGLLRQRSAVGVVGSDAHGGVHDAPIPMNWPSYEAILGLAGTRLLLHRPLAADPDQAQQQVLAALRDGRAYVAVDALADPRGFRFRAVTPQGVVAQGGVVRDHRGVRLQARLPVSEHVAAKLLRDGQVLVERRGGGLLEADPPGPGIYRVEVRLHHPGLRNAGRLPWILSNPILIGSRPDPPQRAAAGPPAVKRWLWTPRANAGLHVEHDLHSRAEPLERGARGIRYRLGSWSEGEPEVFCALSDRTHRDLSGYQGVALELSADRRSRVELQLRDRLEGSEEVWWRATLPVDPESTGRTVAFTQLRPVQEGVERAFHPEQVQGIFVLVSQDRLRPGTAGEFVVHRLGVY
jgi:hypothetical protein